MRRTALSGALVLTALAALAAGAVLPAQARQIQAQAAAPTAMTPQAGAPTPQQAQKAQESRSDAEAYLQRAEARTDNRPQAVNRPRQDAGVLDEASGASASGGTRAGTPATTPTVPAADAPPPYGPVLNPHQPQAADPARRNPAEVHDETDTGANPAAQQPASQPGRQRNNPQAARRHPAWQPAGDPMAPRPLREERATASNPEPVPAPSAAPRPVVPTSTALNGCAGGNCVDAAGNRYNGAVGASGNAGVSASGRLCNRSGATVQCF